MRLTIAIGLVVAFGLLNTGCVNSKPVHYYTVETPPAPATAAATPGPVILVGDISVPAALQDGRIHYRTGSNEVGGYEYHRWTERPGMMVGTSLVRALRASGKYRSVMESGNAASGDYLLRGRLFEFGEEDRDTIQTKISLHLQLQDMKTRHIIWDNMMERTEPVKAKSVPDVVQSLDRNLQAVVNQTAAEIDRFLTAKGN